MTAPTPTPRRKRWVWLFSLILIPAGLFGLSWYFTEPLTDHAPTVIAPPPGAATTAPASRVVEPLVQIVAPVVWPEIKVEGDGAKKILLESIKRTVARLDKVEAYTATFRRRERVGGVLGPEITSSLKIRNHPFAIYLKYLAPKPGKEVVYSEGHHDNKVIAHNGDWTRRIVPRLAIAPDSALALADSRHPVTDAGLWNLGRKLLRYREMDMGDDDATTTLDRTTGPDGRSLLRSVHTHSKPDAGRPFAHVEVLYDPETQIPFQISSFDWPGANHSGPLDLAEQYTYDDLKLGAPLTAADFDPTNPEYAFMRF